MCVSVCRASVLSCRAFVVVCGRVSGVVVWLVFDFYLSFTLYLGHLLRAGLPALHLQQLLLTPLSTAGRRPLAALLLAAGEARAAARVQKGAAGDTSAARLWPRAWSVSSEEVERRQIA